VIDDNDAVRDAVARCLTRAGHETVVAPDGLEGVQLFMSEPFDLVVTDIYMPGADGIEVMTILNESSRAVPVIAMSGGGLFSKEHTLEEARQLGVVATIAKPFLVEDILRVVESALDAAPVRHEPMDGS
jgi:CheY-like chemotaxis protein